MLRTTGRSQRRLSRSSALRRTATLVVVAALAGVPHPSAAQLRRSMPDSLTDREFWQFFTSASEDGGSFPSENFVSNEQTYQHVIPTLQRSLTPGGVYLGVGPEQNFTYIANLKPRMAVIFDIRRQNAMAHLMYKALFELSATRADFVSRLFSRPISLPVASSATAATLFAAALAAPMSDSAFNANRSAILEQLTGKHGFVLSPEDTRSITHVLVSFFEAGPTINYGFQVSRPGLLQPAYATYAQLQSLTNAEGADMAFLATEENYQWLRALQRRNLVVPVVGDFAGPKAIRAVGEYLTQRGATVSAFYLSNVEQYLFRGFNDAERFYRNVGTLPLDSTSTFIRSVPPNDGMLGATMTMFGRPASRTTGSLSVQIVDSAGVSVILATTTDSTGKTVTTRTIDSTSNPRPSALQMFRSLRARVDSVGGAIRGGTSVLVGGGGTLVSGIASIRQSLDAFGSGGLASYGQVIAMTKTSGWK